MSTLPLRGRSLFGGGPDDPKVPVGRQRGKGLSLFRIWGRTLHTPSVQLS